MIVERLLRWFRTVLTRSGLGPVWETVDPVVLAAHLLPTWMAVERWNSETIGGIVKRITVFVRKRY